MSPWGLSMCELQAPFLSLTSHMCVHVGAHVHLCTYVCACISCLRKEKDDESCQTQSLCKNYHFSTFHSTFASVLSLESHFTVVKILVYDPMLFQSMQGWQENIRKGVPGVCGGGCQWKTQLNCILVSSNIKVNLFSSIASP